MRPPTRSLHCCADRLALRLDQQVHRSFFAAVIDEVDSILIDEARIRLIIAGGDTGDQCSCIAADQVVRLLRPLAHYAGLTPAPQRRPHGRRNSSCGRRFRLRQSLRERNLRLHTAVYRTLSKPTALLRAPRGLRVKGGAIEMVDEFKGRIAPEPALAGLAPCRG